MKQKNSPASDPKLPTGGILVKVLNWLALANIRYGRREQLRHMSDHALRDVGITREQANEEFYRRIGNRPTDSEIIAITTPAWPISSKQT